MEVAGGVYIGTCKVTNDSEAKCLVGGNPPIITIKLPNVAFLSKIRQDSPASRSLVDHAFTNTRRILASRWPRLPVGNINKRLLCVGNITMIFLLATKIKARTLLGQASL